MAEKIVKKPGIKELQDLLHILDGHRANAAMREKAVNAIRWAFEVEEPDAAERLLEWISEEQAGVAPAGPAPPPEYRTALIRLLLRAASDPDLGLAPEDLARLGPALATRNTESLRPYLGPALRLVIGQPRDEDIKELKAWLRKTIKEASMKFIIDPSSSPHPSDAAAYGNKVVDILKSSFGLPDKDADVTKVARAAAIEGMAVLDGEVDPASSGLSDELRRAWLETLADVAKNGGGTVKAAVVYEPIAQRIREITGSEEQSVQQLAFVAREVIAGAGSNPFGHPNFDSAIRIALDHYVETRVTGDGLTLPPGSLPGGTQTAGGDAELVPNNIRVIGLAYSLALLEKTLLLPVADRMGALFMNGMIQTGNEAAGKALDDYYWDSDDRLTESQRRSHYSRMLGMPGGEVPKEVAPNKDFEQLFLRFIASASEFMRQREVDRMFTAATSALSTTGEQVRKCAFEVCKNASLYGWGGAFYVTTRINKQLQRALDILDQPAILKEFAASNHWQVVERVAQQDFGGTPNWSKYSTMADAASRIFNLLSKYTTAIARATPGQPFLYDVSQSTVPSDVSQADTNELLTSVQGWLAVNGVSDTQVKQYSQPVELTNAPSVPSVAGTGAGSATEVINKLKQLTSGGTPNPDQIQQLLATLH